MNILKLIHYMIGIIALLTSCVVFSAPPVTKGKPVVQNKIESIVVFGDSLSDAGNAFILISDPAAFGYGDCIGQMGVSANVPPYDKLDDFLIPDGSYAKGGHHETNGATWIEQFALGKGLSGNVQPALRNAGTKASNYAVGGARASFFPCRFNLADQLAEYQRDFSTTSANALVVIGIGGNDVRDVLVSGDQQIIAAALTNIRTTIQTLYGQGARNFLLVNVPAIGKTPALKILDTVIPGAAGAANNLAIGFNSGLAQLQGNSNQSLSDVHVRTLDLYTLLNTIIDNPSDFGIINTEDACVTPDIAPFKCQKPDTYLFWDGIHPSKAVHAIMAQRAAEVLMTPIP